MDRDDDGGSWSWARDGDAEGRQCLDRGRNVGAAALGRRRSAWSMPCRGCSRCSHVDRDGGGGGRVDVAPGRVHGAAILPGPEDGVAEAQLLRPRHGHEATSPTPWRRRSRRSGGGAN
jgi:hypothetical protein